MERILELLEKAKAEVEVEKNRAEVRLDMLETEYTQASKEYDKAEDDMTVSDEDFEAISSKNAEASKKYNRQRCDLHTIIEARRALDDAISKLTLYVAEWD